MRRDLPVVDKRKNEGWWSEGVPAEHGDRPERNALVRVATGDSGVAAPVWRLLLEEDGDGAGGGVGDGEVEFAVVVEVGGGEGCGDLADGVW